MYLNTIYRSEVVYHTHSKEPWEPYTEIVEYVKDFVRHSRYVYMRLPALRAAVFPPLETGSDPLVDFFNEQLLQHITAKREGHQIELHCDGVMVNAVDHRFFPVGIEHSRAGLTVMVSGPKQNGVVAPLCEITMYFTRTKA